MRRLSLLPHPGFRFEIRGSNSLASSTFPSAKYKKRHRNVLSDEQLLVLAVGLTVGALGLWLILRVSN